MRSFASAWYTLGCNCSLLTSCPSAFPFVPASYVCWLLSVCGFQFISLHCHCLYLGFRVWVFLHTVLLSLWGTTYVCFAGGGETPVHTKIILSSHNYESTPSDVALDSILDQMWKQGADIAKIATTATDITDCARLPAICSPSQHIQFVTIAAHRLHAIQYLSFPVSSHTGRLLALHLLLAGEQSSTISLHPTWQFGAPYAWPQHF